MSKSPSLRVQDIRNVFRLLGDCRDLASDPALWQPRMFDGLSRLIGGAAVAGGEGRWLKPASLQPVTVFDTFEDSARQHFLAYVRDNIQAVDPVFQAIERIPGLVVTRTRRQLVPDASWYRSPGFNDYRRKAHVDHQLTSMCHTSPPVAISMICVHRAVGDRDYTSRERRLLHFFHTELRPLVGTSLVSALEPSPRGLSPRLRQTLACLLQGDSEKQVAARLGVSQATTHQYVTMLYRRFGVCSRAQLMAYAFRRTQRDGWKLGE
jgi:DNA-binding CsgD family transcriptional regulator